MSFITSKIFWGLSQPGNALAFLLGVGVLLLFSRRDGRRRAGRTVVAVAAAGFLVLMVVPVGTWAIRLLEDRFPPTVYPARVDGIILLGGAVNPPLAATRDEPSLNEAAERLLAFAEMGRLYPAARMIASGGSGSLWGGMREGEVVREVLDQIGFDSGRVVFENESRNTWENALFSQTLAEPKLGETWVLITSAWHMPRAMGIFRRIGWTVIPHPVDYRSRGDGMPYVILELSGNMALLTTALREWIGLAAYRLMGRTDALFPAPYVPPADAEPPAERKDMASLQVP